MTLAGDEIDGLRDLPPWFRFTTSRANSAMDYNTALDDLKRCKEALPKIQASDIALQNCHQWARNYQSASKNPFATNYLRFKILQRLYSEIIFCMPEEMLISRWNTTQKRVEGLEQNRKEKTESLPAYKNCKAFFEGSEPPEKDSLYLRSCLREIQSYLDEDIEVQVWKSSVLWMRTTIFSLALIPTVWTLSQFVAREKADSPLSVAGFLLAAFTGGLLSSIVKPSQVPAPMPSEFVFLRPIMASAAGLILWLLNASDVIKVANPEFAYLFAIAIGFTDDLLTKILLRTSKTIASSTLKSLGHD